MQKALSMLTRDEMKAWFRSFWTDIQGASTRAGHPAPFPTALAARLIRMFSLAAINTGRNSIGVDVESKYLRLAYKRLRSETAQLRYLCSTKLDISREGF
jgi:DNA modification methylase